MDAKKLVGDHAQSAMHTPLINIQDFQHAINGKFGEYEAMRVGAFFIENDTNSFTF